MARTEKDSVRQLVKRRQVNSIHLSELHSTRSEQQLLRFRREATTSFAELRGIVWPLFEDARRPQPLAPPPPKPRRRRQRPTPFVRPPPSAAGDALRPRRLPAFEADALDEAERLRALQLQTADGTAAGQTEAYAGQPVGSHAAGRSRAQRQPPSRDFSIPLFWPARTAASAAETAALADVGLRLLDRPASQRSGGTSETFGQVRRARGPWGLRSSWDPHPVTSGLRRARTLLV